MIRARSLAPGASLALAALLLAPSALAQAHVAPPRTLVRAVRLAPEAEPVCLLLSDGRIEAVLPGEAETPAGVREVDGAGHLALPAFVDAFSAAGVDSPDPVVDQDAPVDTGSDVRVDMRRANRKGIRPAFRAVEALAVPPETSKGYREAGFGALLSSPDGQLLGGSSALVTTREAAMRDLVLVPDVFAHAAFDASGPGYPSTLMGYFAQLRQFFLDVEHHAELVRRFEAGRPGVRPPWDRELEAGARLLSGERRVCCRADTARDVERWLRLADEHGLSVVISGGRDAWKVANVLAARDVPVILTLDWGEEVDDPHGEDEEEEVEVEEVEPEPETAPGTDLVDAPSEEHEAEEEAAAAEAAEQAGEEASGEEEDQLVWEYEEPLRVREERRRLWEEGRDSAIRLHEAGVRIAFGTARKKPKELLGRVRQLVEAGLDREAALSALTTEPAALLGVEGRLGRLEPGYYATFCLWTKDPLTEEKAQVARSFVDGFGYEHEVKEKPGGDAPPDEGVDVTGTWEIVRDEPSEMSSETTLELVMDEDGTVTGTMTSVSGFDGETRRAAIDGRVSGSVLTFEVTLTVGEDYDLELGYELRWEEGTLRGNVSMEGPGFSTDFRVTGTKRPEEA